MMFVIFPTEDPDVQMAYQCADEQAAEELATKLINEHGKRAVLAKPFAIAVPKVQISKMVRE